MGSGRAPDFPGSPLSTPMGLSPRSPRRSDFQRQQQLFCGRLLLGDREVCGCLPSLAALPALPGDAKRLALAASPRCAGSHASCCCALLCSSPPPPGLRTLWGVVGVLRPPLPPPAFMPLVWGAAGVEGQPAWLWPLCPPIGPAGFLRGLTQSFSTYHAPAPRAFWEGCEGSGDPHLWVPTADVAFPFP